nr:MAG TPA: tail assembly chaperone protein [Caudoviricetes sp.]
MENKNENVLEKLLRMDAKKITERPMRTYEVKRLSNIMGTPFVITLQSIPAELYSDIQNESVEIKKGNVSGVNIQKLQFDTVIAGMKDPNLKDKQLLQHFDALTPVQLVNKLFIPGEISDMASIVSELCGFTSQKDVDEETKN